MVERIVQYKSYDLSHSDVVNDFAIDFYNRRLASCSSDTTINIHDITSEKNNLITTLEGHDGPVWQVAWSDPSFGTYLASCSYDKKVIIWKEEDSVWKREYTHVTHMSSVVSLEWAPKELGLILASCSYDRTISVISFVEPNKWEYTIIPEVDKVHALTLCWGPPYHYLPDNKHEKIKQIATAGFDGLIKIFRCINNKWIESDILNGEQDQVRSISWVSVDFGRKDYIGSCYMNNVVMIWSRNDKSDGYWEPNILKQYSDIVWHVSFSNFGNLFSVSYGDGGISIWKNNLQDKWDNIET